MHRSWTSLLLVWMLTASALIFAVPSRAVSQKPKTPPFYTGADLSELPIHEHSGVAYSDAAGSADLLTIVSRNGWNTVRVRLWVNPVADPFYKVSSLTRVTEFGRRIKLHGLKFLLDIHYSDTWADPGHQTKPAAWTDLKFSALVQKTHDYTRDVIKYLVQNDAAPDLVQVGNETRNGLLYGSGINGASALPGGGFWEKDGSGVDRALLLLQAGLQGVRDGSTARTMPRTIIHIPDGQDPDFVRGYFELLETHGSKMSPPVRLNFDIVGLSYYPAHPWDRKAGYPGWQMTRLSQSMNYVAAKLQKPVMVVETAWPYSGKPDSVPGVPEYSFTPVGQTDYYRALIKAVRAVPNHLGKGVIPWDQDTLNWDSVFDKAGHALPAVWVLGKGMTH